MTEQGDWTTTERLVAAVTAELNRRRVALGVRRMPRGQRGEWRTWRMLLMADAYHAADETRPAALKAALLEVAASALEWLRDIELTDGEADSTSAPLPDPSLGYYVPPTRLTPGGPVHGGFRVTEAGNYDQP
jgi:hypothetical protein